jgi:hypothetical protein
VNDQEITRHRVIQEAKRRFDLYVTGKDTAAVNPSLRSAIYGIAMRYGGDSEYNSLKKEWHSTGSVDGKEIALRAMGRIQTPELLADYLDFMSKDVPSQDVHTAGIALSANSKTRDGLWKYIKDNFSEIHTRLSGNMVVLDRFLRVSLNKFSDRETEKDIAAFFAGKDNRGYDRTLNILSDTISGRAAYKERDGKVVLEWLKINGYA